jgi:glutamate 5-kinase
MATKIQAAKIATAAGVRTVITKSTMPERIALIMDG